MKNNLSSLPELTGISINLEDLKKGATPDTVKHQDFLRLLIDSTDVNLDATITLGELVANNFLDDFIDALQEIKRAYYSYEKIADANLSPIARALQSSISKGNTDSDIRSIALANNNITSDESSAHY